MIVVRILVFVNVMNLIKNFSVLLLQTECFNGIKDGSHIELNMFLTLWL